MGHRKNMFLEAIMRVPPLKVLFAAVFLHSYFSVGKSFIEMEFFRRIYIHSKTLILCSIAFDESNRINPLHVHYDKDAINDILRSNQTPNSNLLKRLKIVMIHLMFCQEITECS